MISFTSKWQSETKISGGFRTAANLGKRGEKPCENRPKSPEHGLKIDKWKKIGALQKRLLLHVGILINVCPILGAIGLIRCAKLTKQASASSINNSPIIGF